MKGLEKQFHWTALSSLLAWTFWIHLHSLLFCQISIHSNSLFPPLWTRINFRGKHEGVSDFWPQGLASGSVINPEWVPSSKCTNAGDGSFYSGCHQCKNFGSQKQEWVGSFGWLQNLQMERSTKKASCSIILVPSQAAPDSTAQTTTPGRIQYMCCRCARFIAYFWSGTKLGSLKPSDFW